MRLTKRFKRFHDVRSLEMKEILLIFLMKLHTMNVEMFKNSSIS